MVSIADSHLLFVVLQVCGRDESEQVRENSFLDVYQVNCVVRFVILEEFEVGLMLHYVIIPNQPLETGVLGFWGDRKSVV